MVQNSRPKMFFKKAVLKNFARFTGKHLCWSHFLIKLQVFMHRYFAVNIATFLRSAFLQNTFFPYEYYYQELILKYHNDTHKEKLRFDQFSTRMGGWLLLTYFICLQHNQLSSIHFPLSRIKSTDIWKM